MTTLIKRVITGLEERRERVLNGDINCIPLPFKRFRSELPGVEQETYYLVSGGTKSAKTRLVNYIFVYNTIMYAYYNQGVVCPKIFYYPLEETSEAITLRFMSYLLYVLSGKRISPTDLRSTDSEKPLDEEIIDLLRSEEYTNILDYYEEVISFMPSRNPTGVWKDLKSYADNHGTVHNKKCIYKDEFGVEHEGEQFDYYEPNNPNEYVFIIIDHVSLLETERGLTLRECINKLSEYMVIFRNRYKYIPVIVQQQSVETTNLDAFKNNKIRPTPSGLADSKGPSKDCSIMLGITNPFSHELREYLGYDINKFKGEFRCLEVVLNRNGSSNGICPLFFDGAIGYFSELPLPNNKIELDKVYKYLDKIRNNIVEKSNVSMHIYASKHNDKYYNKTNNKQKFVKKLHYKNILSKFATLFNLNNK